MTIDLRKDADNDLALAVNEASSTSGDSDELTRLLEELEAAEALEAQSHTESGVLTYKKLKDHHCYVVRIEPGVVLSRPYHQMHCRCDVFGPSAQHQGVYVNATTMFREG